MKLSKILLFLLAFYLIVLPASAQEDCDKLPRVIAAVAPIYPATAAATNTSGEIIIEVTIDKSGKVKEANIKEGNSLLKKAKFLEQVAKKWVFNESEDNSVERKAKIIFSFRIIPSETLDEDLLPIFFPPNKVEVKSKKQEPITDVMKK